MALSSTPSLIEINTELGTSGQSLSTCIANAGKTGIWDRQSDFAGYSHAETISINPTTNTIAWNADGLTTVIASDPWRVRTPLPSEVISVSPSSGPAGSGPAIIFLEENEGSERVINVVFELTAYTSISATLAITQQAQF